jgi:hypothetical protein
LLPSSLPLRLTYIGHATLLVEIGGITILTDPNFDRRLAGVLPRVGLPGRTWESLPDLDAVLLTHAHADPSLRERPSSSSELQAGGDRGRRRPSPVR